MQLIGMLDSPYVRRVAISLQLLELPFEHRPLSVFRAYEEFRHINPLVKVPTLICDDGTVLVESTLILDYAEALTQGGRTLMPRALPQRLRALRRIGLALVACEKSVQIIYERNLRPPEKQHEPWIGRVSAQLQAAYQELEAELGAQALRADASIDQAGISTAVAWQFTQQMLPEVVPASTCPLLAAFSASAEALPPFRAAPHGPGTYRQGSDSAGTASVR
jgi:glutathione S-transferase